MNKRTIGDVVVSAIGLGGMPMSIEGRPDAQQSIATIHASLDAGVTFFDTADSYHWHADEVGHNETLFGRAIGSMRWSNGGSTDGVLVATKGGHLRPGDGRWTQNGHPDYLKQAAKASLSRLGGDAIGLYQFHRPDAGVPYADSVGALADLLDEGVIRMAGISNASVEQIKLAQEVLGGRLVSVQNRFSPSFRSSLPELEYAAEIGIAFLPWSPLGGIGRAADLGSKNDAFQTVADAHGVSAQQVALAWELALAPVVVPIPGASKPASIQDSALAADLVLTQEEIQTLSA